MLYFTRRLHRHHQASTFSCRFLGLCRLNSMSLDTFHFRGRGIIDEWLLNEMGLQWESSCRLQRRGKLIIFQRQTTLAL